MAYESNITKASEWFRNEDKTLTYTIYTTDALTTAANISSYTLGWYLSTSQDTEIHALTKTTALGTITITDGANGVCAVTITGSTDTRYLAAGTYWMELWRLDVHTLLSYGTAVLRNSTGR